MLPKEAIVRLQVSLTHCIPVIIILMDVPLITLQHYIRFILKEHVFCDLLMNTLVRNEMRGGMCRRLEFKW